MSGVRVSVEIEAPPSVVWADVRNIASHVEWMADAEAIRITSEATEGTGVVFECDTKVGPIRLTDKMQITEWVDEKSMGVKHAGVVTGSGVFTLEPLDGGTRTLFTWQESLQFPWWLGGPIGREIGGRIALTPIWKRNLKRLQARFAQSV
jgi:hypothetical protein